MLSKPDELSYISSQLQSTYKSNISNLFAICCPETNSKEMVCLQGNVLPLATRLWAWLTITSPVSRKLDQILSKQCNFTSTERQGKRGIEEISSRTIQSSGEIHSKMFVNWLTKRKWIRKGQQGSISCISMTLYLGCIRNNKRRVSRTDRKHMARRMCNVI